jgi:hypothetical protein
MELMKSSRSILSIAVLLALFVLLVFAVSPVGAQAPYPLVVKKEGAGAQATTWRWTIEKSADQTELTLTPGGSADVNYEVSVTAVAATAWTVTGNITIRNLSGAPINIHHVVDTLSDGTVATITLCRYFAPDGSAGAPISLPYIGLGATTNPTHGLPKIVCDYEASNTTTPPPPDNMATVYIDETTVGGVWTHPVVYDAVITDRCITLDDTFAQFGDPITVCAGDSDKTFTYTVPFGPYTARDCKKSFEYPNTASFVTNDTGATGSASQTVVVNVVCSDLKVTKTADGAYDNNCEWTILKEGDQTALTLSVGQSFLVNYDVFLDVTCTPETVGDVSGGIEVSYTDTSGGALTIASVSDVVGGVTAGVDCGVTFPYVLPVDQTLACPYTASGVDTSATTNTATVEVADGRSWDGSADVTWGENKIDGCVDVTDDQFGVLGTVCEDTTFEYALTVGPYDLCGDYQFVNIASFVTNTNGNTGFSSWTVDVNVPCEEGCTLTPGYWKTHSSYGPAPADDTWYAADLDGDGVIEGPDESFFLSGKTGYQVLWTAPGGNAYYILAHAYIAAVLNGLNGASSPPEVDAVIAAAETLFSTYTPAQVAAMRGNNPVRQQFISLAYTLDQYNNGYIGPGHCSE